jgi:hypothetical protein
MDFDKIIHNVAPLDADRYMAEKVIQAWRDKRDDRLAADKVAAALKEQETAMKMWLIDVFKEQKFEGMVIDHRITGLSDREVHEVEDREAFVNYLIENRALDMLQFRISDPAIFAREDVGVVVPGVKVRTIYDLFDRKA